MSEAVVIGSGYTITLTWTASVFCEDTDAEIVKYVVRRSVNGGPYLIVAETDADTLAWVDTYWQDPDRVVAGTTIRYVVTGVPAPDDGIESPFSALLDENEIEFIE